jgi:hypothetical protein
MVDINTYGMFPTSQQGVRDALADIENGRQYREVGEHNGIVLLERR